LEANAPHTPHSLPVATKPRLKPPAPTEGRKPALTEGRKPLALATTERRGDPPPTEGRKPLAPAPTERRGNPPPTEGRKPLTPAPTEGGEPLALAPTERRKPLAPAPTERRDNPPPPVPLPMKHPASTNPPAHPKPEQNRPGTAKALAVVATVLAAGAAHGLGGQVGQPVNRAANASSFDPISPASGLYGETSNQSAPAAVLHDIGGQTSSITQQLGFLESLTIKIQKGMSQFRLVYPRYTTWTDDTRRSAEAEAESLVAKIDALVLSATSGGVTDRLMITFTSTVDAFLKYLDSLPSLAPTEEAPHAPPAAADTTAVRNATGFNLLSFEGKFRLRNNARLAYMLANLTSEISDSAAAAAAALGKDWAPIILRQKNCVKRVIGQCNIVGAGQNVDTFSSDLEKDPSGDTDPHRIPFATNRHKGHNPYQSRARAVNTSEHIGRPWFVGNATDLQRVTSIYATPGAHPSEPLQQAIEFAIEANHKEDPQLVRLLEQCARDVDAGKHTSLTTVVATLAMHTESASYMIDLVTIHTIATVHGLIDALPESNDKGMLRDLFKVLADAYKRNGEQVQRWGWFSRYHKLPSTYYLASVMLDVMDDLQSSMPPSDVVDSLLSAIAVGFSDATMRNKRDPTPYPIALFQDDGALSLTAARYRTLVLKALKDDLGKRQRLVDAILVPDDSPWAKDWWSVYALGKNKALNKLTNELMK
jgi:hypothetical protein